jgi:signal transduction histidine kinase
LVLTNRNARRRTIERAEQQLPDLLGKLRWVVPGLMSALGVGYSIIENYLLVAPAPTHPALNHVVREAAVIGTVGPAVGWVLLTYAARIARSRHQAELELSRRAMQLEIGGQVARETTSVLDIDRLLKLVVRLIRRNFGYDHVQIFLVDKEHNVAALREVSGPAAAAIEAADLRLRIGEEGIVGHVAESGEPVLSNNVEQEDRYLLLDLVPDTRSELALPLQVADRVLGVLDLQSNSPGAFDEQDVQALQLLGDQIAIAIENARLFQETHQRFQAMTALHETSLDIVSQLDSRQVLEAILRRAVELIHAQAASLAVCDAESNLIRVRATHNLPSAYAGITLYPGEGVAGTVVQTGKPVIVNDYWGWEGHSEAFMRDPYSAVIGVPLRWHDEIIGCLTALDRPEMRPFSDEDVWLLSLFADLASIAIKNAELYGTVTDLTQTLEQRVAQRTRELAAAQSELAEKAEQLRELLAVTVRVQEEERTRIARDLHDGSNQLITGTLYQIQAAEQSLLNRKATTTVEKLKTAKQLLRSLEAENRRIIGGLRPPVLDDRGLIPALKAYASSIEQRYGISCSVDVSGQPVRLSSEPEIAVYRIVQECLNNVVAHANAENVRIQIVYEDNRLQVTIQDDGVGFDTTDVMASASGKMGLIGMRERAQSIGGQIEVKSAPGQGSRVVFNVPMVPRNAALTSESQRL